MSLWTLTVFMNIIGGVARAAPTFPQMHGRFDDVYLAEQRAVYTTTYTQGPLPIYTPEWRHLFVAWLASRKCAVHLPCSWTLQAKALWLYETTALLPQYLPKQWGRYAALRQINYVLRLMRLPPTFLPPLRVPGILRRRVGDLRKGMLQAVQALQPPAAREWVLRNIRCVYLGRRKWVQQINLKQHLRRVTAEDFTSWTPQRLVQAAMTLPGMKASVDNWRLPQWPTLARVGAALRESWQQWCWGARLRPAIRFRGADILKRCLVFDIPRRSRIFCNFFH